MALLSLGVRCDFDWDATESSALVLSTAPTVWKVSEISLIHRLGTFLASHYDPRSLQERIKSDDFSLMEILSEPSAGGGASPSSRHSVLKKFIM
jgi:hypothetical protein